jgi:hypothetical protein
MFRLIRIFVSALVLTSAVTAQNIKDTLLQCQKMYEQDLVKIEAGSKSSVDVLVAQYTQALIVIEKKFLDAGDLDNLLLVRKEKERVIETKQMPLDSALQQAPKQLTELQQKGLKNLQAIRLSKEKQVVAAATNYLAGLDELKKSLTRMNKIDEAREVNAEIDRAKKRTEIKESQFAMSVAGESDIPASVKPKEATESAESLSSALRKGLVLYYAFDKEEEGISSQTMGIDKGKAHGGKWLSNGKRGGGYEFSGSDYIDAGQSPVLLPTKAFTYLFWIKYSGDQRTITMMGCHRDGIGGTGIGIDDVRPNTVKLHLNLYPSRASSNRTINDNVWHHLAGVYDGKALRLYIDGVQEDVQSRPGPLKYPSGGHLIIGKWYGEGQYFRGMLDEIMVYDRALSEREVRQIYAAQK